jgi:hypothetical protein
MGRNAQMRAAVICLFLTVLGASSAHALPIVSLEAIVGNPLAFDLTVTDAEDLYAFSIGLRFDTEHFELFPTEGDFLTAGNVDTFFFFDVDPLDSEVVLVTNTRLGESGGVTGSGLLAMLRFETIGNHSGALTVSISSADLIPFAVPEPVTLTTTVVETLVGLGLLAAARFRGKVQRCPRTESLL